MEPKELIHKRQSIWNSPRLLLWPLLLIILVWVLKGLIGKEFHVLVPTSMTGLAVLIWIVAWIKARMWTYVVFEDTVFAQRKFVSRETAEARIAVVRSINVRQSLYQRLLRIGDVVFKTAGDQEDVEFKGISDPESIKRIVQQQQTLIEQRGSEVAGLKA